MRRRLLFVVAILVVLWVLRPGLGLLPTAGDAGDTPAPQLPPPPQGGRDQGEQNAGNRTPWSADRVHSAISVVRSYADEQRFGAAEAALAELLAAPLAETDLRQTSGLAGELREQREQGWLRFCAALRRGEALQARGQLRSWNEAAPPALRAELGDRCRRLGWPDLAQTALPAHGLPAAPALARGLELRVHRHGTVRRATVVDSRPGEVTVRWQEGAAVTYPSLPVVLCEPVAADAELCVALAGGAMAAGDGALARLWLCSALALAPAHERARALAAQLP